MAEAERALIAAKEGDLQTLKSLRRSVPFAADAYGATTLHYASRKGHLACVKWLVEAIGISPIVRGKSGATPLHDAAAQGQLHCVKYFLASGVVDVDVRDVSGHTALHLAARFGRLETAKWLIENGNSSVIVKSRNYMTPVHFCASGGHLTCLEFLVFKAGESSVNEPATDGTTPVYLASQDGNLECLKYLHNVGGKCDARARDGMLPVHGAAQNGHLECIAYLVESDLAKFDERDTSGATPAHYAAAQGHVNVLKWLNLKGDISLTDDLGGSPLHDAAEQGQFESVRFLVEDASLDVDHRDKEGFTPLALAVKSGHRRCVDYLKIAASKKAKAHKRQLIFSKQNGEDGSNIVMSTVSEKAIENVRASNEYSLKMAEAMNHPFMSDFDRNSPDKSGEVKIQAKGHYSSFSFRKGNSAVSLEESLDTAKPNSSAKTLNDCLNSRKIDLINNASSIGNNIGNHNSIKIAGVYSNIGGNNIKWRGNSKLKKQEQIEITDSVPSSDPTSSIFERAKFSAHTTQLGKGITPDASETVKVLGECRLQPLPLVGSDVIPPPVEFSENSDSSKGEVKGLQPPKEIDRVDEEDGRELPKLHGSLEDNQKRVRFRQTDSLSVIVEIMSFDANVSPRAPEEFQDDEEKVIGPQLSNRQPIQGQRHVTSAFCDERVDQSVSKKSQEDLPPWKRQVLLNRKLKEKAIEKAEREKREIKERQWIDVPPWKIPLLAKKEKERLKEEQRLVGMPEWKKNLLTKKGSGQIYRDYHTAGNFVRASNSMEHDPYSA